MPSKSLGTLTLDLIAKTGSFEAGMDKASRKSKMSSREIAKHGKVIGAAIAAGATVAATALTLVVRKQLDLIDTQAKTAQKLRTTYESLSNLARAGELAGVSFQQIEVASRTLDISLGKAAQGIGLQANALKKLNLSAEELQKLPLDEKISQINVALRENVSETERAAVAADLFGARSASAIQQLNPDTIEEAARQVEIFGLNLSDVDAAKVEQANDAMSTFGLLTDGIGKQLTVELAPILKGIGDQFLESAEAAGGLGTVVEDSVGKAVNALAFVIDAADGVGRVFETAADLVIIALHEIAFFAAKTVAGTLLLISKIPGVDYSDAVRDIQEFAKLADNISEEAQQNIQENLEKPLAGEAFKQFYEESQKAGQAAAEDAVKAREALRGLTESTGDSAENAKALAAELKKVQDAAAEADKNYSNLVKELSTDEEKLAAQLRERLAIVSAISDITDEDRNKITSRIAAAATPEAPEFQGLASEVGGTFGEYFKLDDAEKELNDWYEDQLETLNTFRMERSDLNATWDEEELRLKQEHEEALALIERSRWVAGIQGASDYFGQLAVLRESDSKKGRELGKKAAIAQATINAYTAATGAYASASSIPVVGWILGPIAAAAALAAGIANVNTIKGQAHDGIMSVPSSGTWNLEKGERVLTKETAEKQDRLIDDIRRNNGGGFGRGDINQTINVTGTIDRRTATQIANENARKQRQAYARFA